MPEQANIPRYLKIAVDLSTRIVSGDIAEGEKLKGRSILSTEYNVSPETIRRSMSILSDRNVVEIFAGSGIVVRSRENALQFVNSFKDDESIIVLRNKLAKMIEKRHSLDNDIDDLTAQIIDMYKSRRSDLIKPVEITLPDHSPLIGNSIGKLEIWHNTGATIIAVIQGGNIVISPGPYFEFAANDKILIVGDKNVIERFNVFISSSRDV